MYMYIASTSEVHVHVHVHVKDSLTYRPSSQGWASGVLPLIICLFYGVYVFCVGNLVGSWFLSFLSCESFLASML